MRKSWAINRSLSLTLGLVLAFALFFVLSSVFAWTNPTQAPPGGSGVGIIPAGTIVSFGGSSAPSGWLLCNGSSVSTGTYSALFDAIGYAYGGSGGNFNLPDMRGRTAVAKGTQTDVATLGNSDGETLANRRPKHRTSLNWNVAVIGGSSPFDAGALGNNLTSIVPTAGPQTNAPTDAPAYLVVNCIIKT